MKRVIVVAVLIGCGGVPAGAAARPAITGPPRPVAAPSPTPSPSPAAATFSGTITSATGRYAGDHGHVVIKDGPMASHRGGRLLISAWACHGAPHCLALSGMPPGSLTLKGHPIPDTGFTYTVRAAGHVGPLGHVSISGLLQVPGFVACGHQTLTLTLAGAHGTVKVTAATPTRCVSGPPD
ncbi:MAG: hypothetical protein ACXVRW_08550 [Solirubrobacteraceae bacterium]